MNCKLCGGPTVELFLSRACKAECDLQTGPRVLTGEAALNALLAHKAITDTDNPPAALYFHPDVRWFTRTDVRNWHETTYISLIRGKTLPEAQDIIRAWWASNLVLGQGKWLVCEPPEVEV